MSSFVLQFNSTRSPHSFVKFRDFDAKNVRNDKISLVQNNAQKFITVEKQRYKTFLEANLPHALMLHPLQQVQSSVLYNINSLTLWSDQHVFSPDIITSDSNVEVMKIWEMITN